MSLAHINWQYLAFNLGDVLYTNNDGIVSSTKIRLLLKRDLSITYLIPSPVIEHIMEHRLYMDDDKNTKSKEKQPASK